MSSFTLEGMPAPFSWQSPPPSWRVASDGALVVQSGPKNDHFHDPASGSRVATAPCALMASTEASFILGAHVAIVGRSTFDAGLIFVQIDADHWAKFCLELSPAGRPTIVSVVTRGVSDDCNSAVLDAPRAFLRVAKTPRTFAFHWSADGRRWDLVRYFSLGEPARVQIGWVAQSPLGDGCEATFSQFSYRVGELANLRDGQ